MRSEAIEVVVSEALRLRVDFVWRGDRFGHVISLVGADGALRQVLESIEGSAADDWPSSPALQSLSVETLPDGRRAALLVGMAGGSHWSASVEPIAGEAALVFDVACRHSKQPGWLGSRYKRIREGQLKISGAGLRVVEEGEQMVIEPSAATVAAGTTRWAYVVRLPSAEQ